MRCSGGSSLKEAEGGEPAPRAGRGDSGEQWPGREWV